MMKAMHGEEQCAAINQSINRTNSPKKNAAQSIERADIQAVFHSFDELT